MGGSTILVTMRDQVTLLDNESSFRVFKGRLYLYKTGRVFSISLDHFARISQALGYVSLGYGPGYAAPEPAYGPGYPAPEPAYGFPSRDCPTSPSYSPTVPPTVSPSSGCGTENADSSGYDADGSTDARTNEGFYDALAELSKSSGPAKRQREKKETSSPAPPVAKKSRAARRVPKTSE